MMEQIVSRIINLFFYTLPLGAFALLFLFFNMTNPKDIGPLGIFVVFTLLYIFSLGFVFTLLRLGGVIIGKVRKKKVVLGTHKLYYIASVVAFLPVLLLGIQSVGQLELRDVALVFLFIGLIIFYIIKRT